MVDKGNNDGYTSNARSFSTAHNVLLGYDLKNGTRVSGTIDIGAYEFIEKPDMPAPSLSWAPAGGGGGGGTPNKPEPPKCTCDGCTGDGCECNGNCPECKCPGCEQSVEEPTCPCEECDDCDCPDCGCGEGGDEQPNCPCDKHCFGILFCKCLILGCKKCWLTKWMRFILGLFF